MIQIKSKRTSHAIIKINLLLANRNAKSFYPLSVTYRINPATEERRRTGFLIGKKKAKVCYIGGWRADAALHKQFCSTSKFIIKPDIHLIRFIFRKELHHAAKAGQYSKSTCTTVYVRNSKTVNTQNNKKHTNKQKKNHEANQFDPLEPLPVVTLEFFVSRPTLGINKHRHPNTLMRDGTSQPKVIKVMELHTYPEQMSCALQLFDSLK